MNNYTQILSDYCLRNPDQELTPKIIRSIPGLESYLEIKDIIKTAIEEGWLRRLPSEPPRYRFHYIGLLDLDHPEIGFYILGLIIGTAVKNGDLTYQEASDLSNEIMNNREDNNRE